MFSIARRVFGISSKVTRGYCSATISRDKRIDAIDKPATTIYEVKQLLQKKALDTIGLSFNSSPSQTNLAAYLPKSQDELPPRTMQDSFQSAIIPLSTDADLRHKYMSFLGYVRLGRLLEDMDLLAGLICHSHILNPKLPPDAGNPYLIVTILVDQVQFADLIPRYDADIKMSGHVSWVGTSSIEVVVWLEQKIQEKWTRLTRALFFMACRDPIHRKALIINKIIPGNQYDQNILDGGEQRKKRRQIATQESLLKVLPTEEEQKIIHNLFLKSLDINDPSFTLRKQPAGSIWMEDAALSNVKYCHPEHRNMNDTVFGGFLMRSALELSWTCGWIISKHRPKMVHISDMVFHKAVEISSLLRMKAQMTYSEGPFMQIMVNIEVYDPKSGDVSTSNVFHFTYKVPETVPIVVPKTYQEAILYLDGRRHFQSAMSRKCKK